MRHLLFLLLFPTLLAAQCPTSGSPAALALDAYLANDLTKWDQALDAVKALPASDAKDIQLAQFLFGAAGAALALKEEDAADDYTDRMEAPLDRLLDADKNHPAANGLYSAYLGLLIAQSPMKGMLYGSKSSRLAKKGVKENADDPTAQYSLGSNLHYTPTTWGGDPEAAVAALKKAAATYPADADGCDWFHLQTLALLGQAQTNAGDQAGARMTYLQALQLQPAFSWVKNVLLPNLK